MSYYQQVGRAGRAIDHASVVLLPSPADEGVWDYFATATIPVEAEVQLLAALEASDGPASVPQLEAETGLRRTKVELYLKQLAVAGVTERVVDGWLATGQPGCSTPSTTTACWRCGVERRRSCAPTPAVSGA